MVLYYLLNYPYQILIIPPVLVWAFLNLRQERQWRGVLWVAVIIAIAMAGILYLAGVPEILRHDWSANRLAWPMSWALGHRLYYPAGEGPVLTRLYGPGVAIAYLPAVMFTSTPTAAVLIGSVIDLLLIMLPAIWFVRRTTQTRERIVAIGAIALFAILSMRNPMMFYSMRMVTTDAPAIAMAACACAILNGAAGRNPWRVGFMCAIAASFAIWSKQTLAPVVIALMGYALLIDGWKWAMRFSLALAAGGMLISLIIVAAFGWNELYFNLYLVPRGRPWRFNWLESYQPVLRAVKWIWRDAMPIGWLALAAIALKQDLPRPSTGGLRAWSQRNPWLLPLLAAIVVLPTTAYAYAQVGGQSNSAAPSGYFALLAAVTALVGAWQPHSNEPLPARHRLPRLAFVSLLIACTFSFPDDLLGVPSGFRAWGSIGSNNNEIAFKAMKEAPDQLFFPQYPLASMLADRKVYHHEDGLFCLDLVGLDLGDEQFRKFLPEHLRAVILPVAPESTLAVHHLPEFKRSRSWDRIPTWHVLTRE